MNPSLTRILQLISIVFLFLNKINLIIIIYYKKRAQSVTIIQRNYRKFAKIIIKIVYLKIAIKFKALNYK